MKLSLSPLIVSAFIACTTAGRQQYSPSAAFVHIPTYARPLKTKLFISSWSSKGRPTPHGHSNKSDPSENIQSYIPEPTPASSRPNLEGTVLVSGFANSRDRTDQKIFDLLNVEDSAFKFSKIVAFVDDAKFSKKRLISRTARYTGLLDKLDFVEPVHPAEKSESEDVGDGHDKKFLCRLPTVEQLQGVTSWVANVGNDLSLVHHIGQLSVLADVRNVSILISDASDLDMYESIGAVKTLRDRSFTVVAVGDMDDSSPEGSFPYSIAEFGTKEGEVPPGAMYSRDESMRLVAECLGLKCASGRAFTFNQVRDVNATETKLIRGLREAGYVWSQEIEHMVNQGAERYEAACKEYETIALTQKTEAEEWMEHEEDKLNRAKEEEDVAHKAVMDELLRRSEEKMAAERERVEEGTAEWA